MGWWSLPKVCRFISWFAIVGGLLVALFGCTGLTSSSPAFGVALCLGGMIAFASGLVSLTLIACFGPASSRLNPANTRDDTVETTVDVDPS